MKKTIFFLFILLFSSIAFADSLEQVKLKTDVPLNEYLTVSAQYVNSDGNNEILCSFRVFDTQTTDKYLIKRFSDEYTSENGFVTSERKITEPLFQRGFDYNIVVCCETACFYQNFFVSQKDDIWLGYNFNSLFYDVLYFNDPDIILPIFIMLFIFIVLIYGIWIRRGN